MKFYTNVRAIGNNVFYRGIEDDKRIKCKVEYNPTYYVSSPNPTGWETISGESVAPVKMGSINEAKKFLAEYKEVDNFKIYGDIGFDVQFIADRFKEEISWDFSKLSVHIIDIETTGEHQPDKKTTPDPIVLISMINANTREITTFYYDDYINTNAHTLIKCENEKDLLFKFMDYWTRLDIDVLSGWYSLEFDVPYIINRIKVVLGEEHPKKLSPWGMIHLKEFKDNYGNEDFSYDIVGMSLLDLRALYRKFIFTKQESYSLEHICNVELNSSKLDHSEFNSFYDFYKGNFNKYLEYNQIDCLRVLELDDKLKLIELALMSSYFAKINFNDIFYASKIWDAAIYNHLLHQKKVIPPKSSVEKTEKFPGAYVEDPIPGFYEWVVTFDATSLYPSIIQAWNISPETFLGLYEKPVTVDGLLNKEYTLPNVCVAANGAMYSKDKPGLFPELIDFYMDKRKAAKGKMLSYENELEKLKKESKQGTDEYKKVTNLISKYKNEQQAFKVSFMNSLYGCLGLPSFRYCKLDNAKAITLTGQYIIKSVRDGVNSKLNSMFNLEDFVWAYYIDTDSNFVTLKPIVDKYYKDLPKDKIVKLLEKISVEKITPIINSFCDDIQSYTNVYRNTINFKIEKICSNGVNVAKKRYFLNVHYNEGVFYNTPKLQVTGIEVVKSSTPQIIRDKLKKGLEIILDGGEEKVQDYIRSVREEFKTYSIEQIAFPRSVNGITKYGTKGGYGLGTPVNTKGAIIYNSLLKKLKLTNKYARIKDGDNIKYCYLKLPNPLQDKVIAFHSELPREFNLHDYVDYNLQFEKTFLEPLANILEVIGWKPEKVLSISSFF